jgi:hypothetical protein
MTDNPEIDTEVTAQDRAVADQLNAARLLPAAGFRGALGRHLSVRDPGYGPRPGHLWLVVLGCLLTSLLLLALGALQATGAL